MGVVTYINDKLSNLVANLGTSRDKASHTNYCANPLADETLINAYRYAWLPRKIVDIPALDATREWRQWQAEAEQISRIESEEKRLGLQRKTLECLTKARLFGGAGIYIGTGDQDPSQPLSQSSQVRHLTVLTRRQLIPGDVDIEPDSPRYGKPAWYQVTGSTVQTIHPSRVVQMIGNPLPDDELAVGNEYGWGDSILTAVYEAVQNADSTSANIASLIFEAKIDVIKIPDLMEKLRSDPDFENEVTNRLRLAAQQKGINGALMLDGEEDYQQKSANFANLKDILMAYLQIVSGAADIPMTRLLGQTATGLNSTGESDIRNYYDRIASMQSLEISAALADLDEMIIRQALGSRPPEIWYQWASLWQPDAKEQAEIGKSTADTISILAQTRLFPDDALSEAATNMLTERGVMPGLDQAVEEVIGEGDSDDGDQSVVTDAAPRTLYVARKVTNAEEILEWARGQGIPDLLSADDLHVTVAFSRQPVDWMKLYPSWDQGDDGSLTVPPGGARLMDVFGEDAVVLLFNSAPLAWRHRDIIEAGASWDWPDYQPHITLTYSNVDITNIEPYRGRIELGPEVFEEVDDDWKARATT